MRVSPSTHFESHLTGSTIPNLIAKAKALGRTHVAYTDLGNLSSSLKVSAAAKKAGLKYIQGIEIYFKDSDCPFTKNTTVARCRYFNLSLYCEDQNAYQELCKIVSEPTFDTITIHDEKISLWTWEHLKRIAAFNVNIVLSGVHCPVGKAMLAGKPEIAEEILKEFMTIFPGRVRLAIVCEPWKKKWNSIVQVKYADGSHDSLMGTSLVTTNRAKRIKALDLVDRAGHTLMKSKYVGSTFYDVNKAIKSATLHKGFLSLPGGDATFRVNELFVALSHKLLLPLMVSDYAFYADKEDKIVQTMRLDGVDVMHSNLHMKSTQEIGDYLVKIMGLNPADVDNLTSNNDYWATLFDGFKFQYDWRLADVGPEPLKLAMEIIQKNGRMRWDNPTWVARLKEELEVIAKNPRKDLTPYFIPICDVMDYCKQNGVLTGPLRGSCGGSLFCYLLGITQVDPFVYDLPFSRFFSMDRIMTGKLPDIDSDLSSREILVGEDGKSGYLYQKYPDKVAQISTRNTIRLKTAIKDTNRYVHGKVEPEIEILTKNLPAPQQGVADNDMIFGYETEDGEATPGLIETSPELKAYIKQRPKEWDIVEKSLGITRSFGVHPAAFILSDEPIKNTVPLINGNVAQYEMKEVEAAGLVKYDFLVVDHLKDIEICLNLINQKNGETHVIGDFTHEGKKRYIWDLPEVPDVYKSVWNGSTETVFQIKTHSMTPFVMQILPQNMEDLGLILALVRPGPLDFIDEATGRTMADEYVARRKGESEWSEDPLAKLIPETYGVLVYQEQIGKIARSLAGFSGEDAEKLRENIGKKKMAELQKMKVQFIAGATSKTDAKIADEIWEKIVTFGRYGFNKSHSIGYAHITYACMFLKHYYPLEWWAAILTNADQNEINGELWQYVKDKVLPPDINLSNDTMVVDYAANRLRSKLGVIRGLGTKSIEPIISGRPYKDVQDFVDKEVAGNSLAYKLIYVGVLDSLFPKNFGWREKMQSYADAVQIKEYRKKSAKAEAEGKKLRALQPKTGQIPDAYLKLTPFEDVAIKKSILPNLPIDLYAIGKLHSGALSKQPGLTGFVDDKYGRQTLLIPGKRLQALDETPGENVSKNVQIAVTCFIIDAKEFAYSKNTRKALKFVIDCDGYTSERVLWPDYNTGELLYPSSFKKDAIATVYLTKRAGVKELKITGFFMETDDKLTDSVEKTEVTYKDNYSDLIDSKR